jgi:hypothetical protein
METVKAQKKIESKKIIANEITMFLRSFKWSFLISIGVFLIFWVGVYSVPGSLSPKLPTVEKRDGGLWSTATDHDERVFSYAYGEVWDPSYLADESAFNRAHENWVQKRSVHSLLWAVTAFILFPLIFIVGRLIFKASKWIEENKTI